MESFTLAGYVTLALLSTIISLLGALYLYYQTQFQYWKKRKVFYVKPNFPFGNMGDNSFKKSLGETIKDIYDATKHERFVGIWTLYRPSLLVNDPELIKDLLVRNFSHFQDRGVYFDEEKDPLAAHLFSMGGPAWRNLRVKLTPTFTSGKMKMMFHTLVDTGDELKLYLEKTAREQQSLEIRDVLARYTTDVISSCAFGIETNSLKNPDAIFRRMGKKFFEHTAFSMFKMSLNFVAPDIGRLFKIRHTKKEVEDFFIPVVKDTIEYREKNNIQRNDFMQLLIQLKNKGYVDDADNKEKVIDESQKFTINQAAAQAFVFFVAGFETSSTAMQFALYELALNPDIQDRARKEIDTVLAKHGGKITYDGIQEMEYLDKVVAESLRKYPPVGFLNRICTKEYKIPDTDVIIEKGTMIQISPLGLQRDPDHFPNPDKFDPERFTEEEKAKRHHYAYLPFGEGPRNCIGNRFGMMQSKVGLTLLLSEFEFNVSEKTPIPVVFDPVSPVIQPKGGMFLKISKRSK